MTTFNRQTDGQTGRKRGGRDTVSPLSDQKSTIKISIDGQRGRDVDKMNRPGP